jgi:hypothetical protein
VVTDRCPECGALYAMVGRSHHCVPKSNPVAAPKLTGSQPRQSNAASKPKTAVAKAKRLIKAPGKATDGGTAGETAPKVRKGRPRLEDRAKTLAATKPWDAAGMSRSSWYKRQAEKRSGK